MQYTIEPMRPNVRPQDPPDYDGITFCYVFTQVLTPWVQPPALGNVTLVVANAQGFVAGMTVVIENGGYYEVVSTDVLNRMTVMNFSTNYNQPPGTGIAPGKVTTTSLPGPPGGTGPPGPQGAQGDEGPLGPPLNPKGSVTSSSVLPSTGNLGDLYITLDTGWAWAWDGVEYIALGPFQGPPGNTGARGPVGGPGPTGPQGAPGSTGPQGSPGSTGPQGPQGPQGSTGTQGPAGPQGPAGTGLNMKGTVPTASALPPTGNQPNDCYTAIDTGHAWVWNGTTWIDIGLIQGPAGPQGPQGAAGSTGTAGATGPQGPQGPTGATGPAGTAGATGPAGAAATVDAGTTTTGAPGTNANVVNIGTTSAAIFNFTVPRGAMGATGAAGIQGPPGTTGAQGTAGASSWTLVATSSFNVPAYGSSVTINVSDTSWVALGEWVYIDDANGAGVAGQMVVTAKTLTSLTLFNPTPTTYPLADTTQDGLLRKVSGLTTDFVDGTNNCQPIVPQITAVRLRSYNAISNPTFEVDQRNAGNSISPTGATVLFAQDRWTLDQASIATLRVTSQQITSKTTTVLVPGTNFPISGAYQRITLTTQQASLGASSYLRLYQSVEGPQARELIGDVHSLSLLVRSSVAGLIFTATIRDSPVWQALTLLCTIPTANTWTLITLPNLPMFPTGGSNNFSPMPGVVGYEMDIVLACGTTNTAPASGSWQAGNFFGAPGMSNFAASAVNSTFDIAFVQHEPGPLCTTLIDKPFSQNLDECLRYFQKTYEYGHAPGTITSVGVRSFLAYVASTTSYGNNSFFKPLVKLPAMTFYDHSNGAANSVMDNASVHHTGTTGAGVGSGGFYGISFTTATTGIMPVYFHYIADTRW